MKQATKFFMMALLAGLCNSGFSQEQWQRPPQKIETIIDEINLEVYAGSLGYTSNGAIYLDDRTEYSNKQLYEKLYKKASQEYSQSHPKFALRSFRSNKRINRSSLSPSEDWFYDVYAVVVEIDSKKQANEQFSKGLDRALENVREGSRLAIDEVSVSIGMNRDDCKDQLINILLDKGYKVVAKEYLEKLYDEQRAQQSGIYNERTTVQENNFSGVGYFINVRYTDNSVRIQIVNVSTGEYESNVTINL